jgi:hypothetical protein
MRRAQRMLHTKNARVTHRFSSTDSICDVPADVCDTLRKPGERFRGAAVAITGSLKGAR